MSNDPFLIILVIAAMIIVCIILFGNVFSKWKTEDELNDFNGDDTQPIDWNK